MKIIYHGHSCFQLIGGFSVCLDPFGGIGLDLPEIYTDYYFCSHGHYDHNAFTPSMGKNAFGEKGFEFKECFHDDVFGAKRGKNIIIKFTLDGFTVAHMGDIGEADNEKVIDFLRGVDVLFIPVGSVYTINAEQALKYVDKIMPKIVIPMHFKTKGCTVDVESVDNFINLAKQKYKVTYFGHEFEPEKSEKTQVCVMKGGAVNG